MTDGFFRYAVVMLLAAQLCATVVVGKWIARLNGTADFVADVVSLVGKAAVRPLQP